MSDDSNPSARIYCWAFRLLQNHDDALDATQEVLLRSVRQPAGAVENRPAWLRRVTTNYCIDFLRRRGRATMVTDVAAATDRALVSAETPQRSAARSELRRQVADGLERLSQMQRAVLVAKVFDGDSFATIARTLALSPSTVKTHYLRAVEHMRNVLQAPDGD